MGLLLQKTNIVRDYLEDLNEGRTFWPREVWSQYAHSQRLDFFAANPDDPQSLACLHHLILDALRHLPAALAGLGEMTNQKVFSSCAMPVMMALATLEEMAGNTRVFKGRVKIRKGLAAKIMILCQDRDYAIRFCEGRAISIREKMVKSVQHRSLDVVEVETGYETSKAPPNTMGFNGNSWIFVLIMFCLYMFSRFEQNTDIGLDLLSITR